jgi:hypothetical protein
MATLSMMPSNMGMGEGASRVGVAVGVGTWVEVGRLAGRDVCVAMGAGEDAAAGPQAVQRTRRESKTRGFML